METKEKILNAARQEFARSGLAGARVDKIAYEAGINKAMIYYHFQSKEKLYQAVIDEHISNIVHFLTQHSVNVTDTETFFIKIAEFLNTLFAERQNFVPIMLREVAAGGDRIRVALERLVSQSGISLRMRQFIDEGIKNGTFRNIDASQAMISFIGMNMFYLLLAPAINTVWEIKDEKDFRQKRPEKIVDLFLYGITASDI